ncbi:hypothetical protein LLG95_08935 [bacterium]|nr:hypothetical protein [bacterium]
MYGAQRARMRMAACLVVAIWLVGAVAVHAQSIKRLGLDEMAQKADNIFVATCTEKKVVFQNGSYVTKYKMKVAENWKGQAKVDKQGLLEMEEMGGSVQTPMPLTSYAQGMANFAEQEEVLLFTQQPTFNPKLQALNQRPAVSPTSPRILGRDQGRFTVVRHPETGERLVSRTGAEPFPGGIRTPLFQRAQKLAQRQAQQVARLSAATSETVGAQVDRDMTAEQKTLGSKFDELTAKAEARVQAAKASSADLNEIVPFESLAAVKARVAGKLAKASAKQ